MLHGSASDTDVCKDSLHWLSTRWAPIWIVLDLFGGHTQSSEKGIITIGGVICCILGSVEEIDSIFSSVLHPPEGYVMLSQRLTTLLIGRWNVNPGVLDIHFEYCSHSESLHQKLAGFHGLVPHSYLVAEHQSFDNTASVKRYPRILTFCVR